MQNKILVLGASGNVGSSVVDYLLQAGQPVAAAVRTIPAASRPGLEYRCFDFGRPDTWSAALTGVARVFLVRPPQIANIRRDMLPFLRYLAGLSLERLVFLSVQGASENRLVPHNKVERYCRQLGLPAVFVRPSFFMQNLTTTHCAEIRDSDLLFVPAGSGRTSFVDTRDIGEACGRLLCATQLLRGAYTLTGEAAQTQAEIAEALSRGLGRTIRYVDPSPLAFLAGHRRRGTAAGFALVMLALYSVVKLGKGNFVTTELAELLGRAPRSVDQFIFDYHNVLTPPAASAGGSL